MPFSFCHILCPLSFQSKRKSFRHCYCLFRIFKLASTTHEIQELCMIGDDGFTFLFKTSFDDPTMFSTADNPSKCYTSKALPAPRNVQIFEWISFPWQTLLKGKRGVISFPSIYSPSNCKNQPSIRNLCHTHIPQHAIPSSAPVTDVSCFDELMPS